MKAELQLKLTLSAFKWKNNCLAGVVLLHLQSVAAREVAMLAGRAMREGRVKWEMDCPVSK